MRNITILILTFSVCIISLNIFSQTNLEQGNPFITNFSVNEYKGHPQIWDIIQDNREFLYFANGDGITIFDGNEWELILLPNKISSRALAKDHNGIIYAAGTNEIGYLQPNKYGKLEYLSLIDSLGIRDIGIVMDITTIKNDIYFRSSDYLILLNENGFKYWKSKSTYNIAFSFNEELFILDTKNGLFKLEKDSLILAPFGKQFINKTFYFAEQFKNEIILADRMKGLYSYNPTSDNTNMLKHIVCEANKFLTENFVNTGVVTKDEKIILGTNRSGCLIINRQGDILYNFTKNKGIQHNNVRTVYIDNKENLWLGLNKGISRCDISLPITSWNELTGIDGIVESIIRYEETIYIATLQGIYYIENNLVHKIPGDIVQAWSFLIFTDISNSTKILLVATTEGIYEVKDKALTKKWTNQISFKLYQSPSNPNIVYFGLRNNIGVLEYNKSKFDYKGVIPNSGISVRTIIEDENEEIWIGTYRYGVVRIIPSDDILNPKEIIHYNLKSGLPSLKDIMVFDFNNTVVFGTEFGLYHFDKNSNKFISDTTFGDIFKGKQKDIYLLAEDNDENVWISQLISKPGSIGIASKTTNGSYLWNSTPLSTIPEIGIRTILVEPNGIIWIGGTEGIFRFDSSIQIDYNEKFHPYIRNVSIKNDSTIFFGNYYIEKEGKKYFSSIQNETFKYKIDYRYNSIVFKYTSPEFCNRSKLKYQYLLEGYDKNWSGWNNITSKEYTNLDKGNYTFKVKAKNLYDKESTIAQYQIQIRAPWYRTIIAYFLYGIVVFLFIWFVVKLYTRKLKKEKEHLEEIVKERTKDLHKINTQLEEKQTDLEVKQEEIKTQRDAIEDQNKELEKLSIVASETDNAITVSDADGNFEWVNDGLCRLFGFSLEERKNEIGKNILDVSTNPNMKEIFNNVKKNKKSVTYASTVKSTKGKILNLQTTLTPIIDDKGEIQKLIFIDADISELKKAEKEILQKNEEIISQKKELENHRNHLELLVKERTNDLEIAKEKAEESDRLKSAFLANMSHEIRTPMNAIIGFSSLLTDRDIVEESKNELVSHIVHNSDTLLRLIDDIIDIAKIEAEQLKINKLNCSIDLIFNELLEKFDERKQTIKKQNIKISINKEVKNNSLIIYTDPVRLQQVLSNLIDNALKYTEKGFVEFGYIFEDSSNNENIKFFVQDTGIGLSKDQQEIIFRRFTKIENNKKKIYRGAGLGLAISKNLIYLLGGDIWVDSEMNKGSTFYFTIPHIKKTDKEEHIEVKKSKMSDFNWSEKTILIAEDEESNYLYFKMLLSKTKANILHADTGIKAVKICHKNKVDLILMDIKMPEMDGLEATKIIKKENKMIPIIALTAFAMENDKKISIEAGCDEYVSKPFNKLKLLSLLNTYLT
ncbi:MAG: response regulator [Bacteroidales bacterium]|nr:response regulator [Bacteroidales bacterium]